MTLIIIDVERFRIMGGGGGANSQQARRHNDIMCPLGF